MLLFIVACAAAFAAAAAIPPRTPVMTGAIAAAASLLLTWIFVRLDGARLDRITPRSVVRFAAGLAAGLILSAAWAAIATGRPTPHPPPASSAVIFILFAIREELAYHGYPLRRLNERLGYWPAQLAIAVLFALEHRISGWTWVTAAGGAFFGSLLFGAAALSTDGLAVPIGMHAAWNIGQSVLGPPAPTLRSTLSFALVCVLGVVAMKRYSLADGKE